MPLPLEDHVRAVLLERDRGQRLFAALRDAWRDFTATYPRRHRWVRKASSRNLFWEEVIPRFRAIELSDDGVEVIAHADTVSVVMDDEVLFRLKHADIALVTQNVPTSEARDFDRHEIDLFGRSGLQRVRLCYVLDEYETSIVWSGIAAHSQGRFLWKIELDDAGLVEAPARLPMDAPEVDTTRLVRLKNPAPEEERKKKKDNGGS